MKKALIFFFLIIFSKVVLTQNNKEVISGHVFELISKDSITPLTGVNVFYLNSNIGTITNEKGFFELESIQQNNKLVFSFTGYKSDTLILNKVKEINVVMSEGKLLEDLIVEYKKGAYTFSKINPINAHTIGQDELRKAACCNLA